MRIFILLLAFMAVSFSVEADTYHVPGQFPRIQMAIDASDDWSTILVDPGTYNETINFKGKKIVVQSVGGPENTVIDAMGIRGTSVVTFRMGETRDAVLEGFTLVDGTGTRLNSSKTGSMVCGGGILCLNTSPTIRNNIIKNNTVENRGGGIYIELGNPGPLITHNTIIDNESEKYGGGVHCYYANELTLEENEISSNSATLYGGGVYAYECNVVMTGNVIATNESNRYSAVYVKSYKTTRIENNEIRGNVSSLVNGALYCAYTEGVISGNTIAENQGGGIEAGKVTLTISSNTIRDNLDGGGIMSSFQCDALIEDNIVTGNTGDDTHAGGIYGGVGNTIIHNIVYGNTATRRGGGIRCIQAALIKDNLIAENTSAQEGGGLFFGGAPNGHEIIEGNTIKNNTALDGGGVYCRNSPEFKNNIIIDNYAQNDGGGLCVESNSNLDICHNLINFNTADGYGGGIFLPLSDAVVYQNEIRGNISNNSGGGICCYGATNLQIQENDIVDNTTDYSGGGIYLQLDDTDSIFFNRINGNKAYRGGGVATNACSNLLFGVNQITNNEANESGGVHFYQTSCESVNNTVFGNTASSQGGGVTCIDSDVSFSNAIFWNNQASLGAQLSLGSGSGSSVIDMDHSDVEDGMNGVFIGSGNTFNWNDGMISAEPSFVSAATGDYHLLYTSPCRNAGNNAATISSIDIEGDPRISSGVVDMGADEFHQHLYCFGDFTPQGEVQANILGVAGASPVYLVVSGSLLEEPIELSIGTFYLAMPWSLIDLLATVPASGLLQLPGELPRLPAAPYDLYMQALVGGKLTNLFTMEVR